MHGFFELSGVFTYDILSSVILNMKYESICAS